MTMLTAIRKNLSEHSVFNAGDYFRYKDYILNRYPNFDDRQFISALARILLRLVDTALGSFAQEHRVIIRYLVFSAALERKPLIIGEDDIFMAALAYSFANRQIMPALAVWVNIRQKQTITLDQLNKMAEKVNYENQGYNQSAANMNELFDNIVFSLRFFEKQIDFLAPKESNLHNTAALPFKKKLKPAEVWPGIGLPKTQIHPVENQAGAFISENNDQNILLDRKWIWSRIQKLKTVFTGWNIEPSWTVPRAAVLFTVLFSFILVGLFYKWLNVVEDVQYPEKKEIISIRAPIVELMKYELPQELRYQAVDQKKLKAYLQKKNSILHMEPYFEAILNASYMYNVNPLLLFAITGQEQGFVPYNTKGAFLIANNPFNVYESWIKYNIDIDKSASIAAVTIIELSKDRPLHVEPLIWINQKYALDPNWHKGVIFFISDMEKALLAD